MFVDRFPLSLAENLKFSSALVQLLYKAPSDSIWTSYQPLLREELRTKVFDRISRLCGLLAVRHPKLSDRRIWELLVNDARERAVRQLELLFDLFDLYTDITLGLPCEVVTRPESRCFEYTAYLNDWTLLHVASLGTKLFKTSCATVFGVGMKQSELPPPVQGYRRRCDILGGGVLYTRLQTLLHNKRGRDSYRKMSFLTSVLHLKKGTLPVNALELEEGLKDHQAAICGALRPVQDIRLLIKTVQDTVKELHFPPLGDLPVPIPSERGHFETSGHDGGAASLLHEELCAALEIPHSPYFFRRDGDKLVAVVAPEGSDGASAYFRDLIERSDGSFPASPAALAEPCKVRVITCGPEREYYAARFIQKHLWGHLSRHPVFRLTGKPVEEKDLEEQIRYLKPDEVLVSGDFQAATDNLSSILCAAVVEELSRQLKLPVALHRLFHGCLVGHTLHYTFGGVEVAKKQINGQLMGSPLSFPILCIINASIANLAMRWGGGAAYAGHLKDARMLINGDDILFPANSDVLRLWKTLSSDAGLIPSVGKNYFSREFCLINSTMYAYSPGKCDWLGLRKATFHEIPKVNFGLLRGMKRSGGELRRTQAHQAFDGLDDLGSRCNALTSPFRQHRPEVADVLFTMFVRYNKDLLKSVPPGISWYAPKGLGGLGLLPVRKVTRKGEPFFSLQQRRVFAYLATRPATRGGRTWQLMLQLSSSPFGARKGEVTSAYIQRACESYVKVVEDLNLFPMVGRGARYGSTSCGDLLFGDARPSVFMLNEYLGQPFQRGEVAQKSLASFERLRYSVIGEALRAKLSPMSEEKVLAWVPDPLLFPVIDVQGPTVDLTKLWSEENPLARKLDESEGFAAYGLTPILNRIYATEHITVRFN